MKVEFLHTRLSLRSRFVIAFFFYTLVALLQILFLRGQNIPLNVFRFAALGLLVIPLWFLKARNFSNKPAVKDQAVEGRTGKGRAGGRTRKGSPVSSSPGIWKTVSVTELDRLRDRIESIRKAKIPGFYTQAAAVVITFISVFLLIFTGVFSGTAGVFVILDLYLIFFPFLWFARVEKWYPAVRGKFDVFGPVLEADLSEKLRLSPMLFFDSDGGEQAPGELVPTDIRLMLAPGTSTPQEVRDELLGAQFQVTYNTGPNGAVPYMYAVFITKGKRKIWESLKNVKAQGFVTEPGSSTEGDTVYGTVVLRLNTKSRSDAYYTRESDIRELLALVVRALESVL